MNNEKSIMKWVYIQADVSRFEDVLLHKQLFQEKKNRKSFVGKFQKLIFEFISK